MKLSKGILMVFWVVLTACQSVVEKPQLNFYHWNTTFSLDEKEETLLQELETKKLYVKYFDVAFNPNDKNIEYRALVRFDKKVNQTIVPCIFITNTTFQYIKDVETFAQEVYAKIQRINNTSEVTIQEIQMDCDWNSTTQKRYFAFLEHLKKIAQQDHILLSATIRLHQIKYQKQTGVPPVEKGYLMCYNMGDIENPNESNSIYQEELLATYTGEYINEYPLDLNIAIPLYNWGLVYRFGRLVEIINDLDETDLDKTTSRKTGENIFVLEKNQYIKNSYLYEGDLIRVEKTPLMITEKGIRTLYSKMEKKPGELVFYHVKSKWIENYDSKDFKDYIDF